MKLNMLKSSASSLFTSYLISLSVLAGFCLGVSTARAGDWSLDARSTSKGDLYDNYYLKPNPDGFVFGSSSNINVDLIHKSAIDRFDLIGDLGYQSYLGTLQPNTMNRLTPNISAKYHLIGKTDSLDLSAGYTFGDVSAVDPLDPVALNKTLTRHFLSASGGYNRTLSPLVSVGVLASLQDVIYSDTSTGAKPSFTSNLSTFLNYKLTKTTDLKTTVGGQWQSINDAQNSLNSSYWIRADISSQLQKNLKFSLGGGPRVSVNAFDDLILLSHPRISSTSLGWVADASLSYAMKSGSISATVSRSVDPDVLGNLQSRDNFVISASQLINEESEFDVSAQYRVSTSTVGVDQKTFLFSPVYRYQLARDWSLAAGYTFTWTDGNAGSARSDDIFLSVSRSFNLSP